MSRNARPIVAFALIPGPKTLLVELMPSFLAIGPFTTIMIVAPERPEATWWRTNSGAASAFTAATTTGRYSGLHPAITALAATFSAVTATLRDGIVATTSSRASPPAARGSSTNARVAGTNGQPAGQPLAL